MQIERTGNQNIRAQDNVHAIQGKEETKAKPVEEKKHNDIQDIYINSKEKETSPKPAGLYRIVNDEFGNKKIEYDRIEKADKEEKEHSNVEKTGKRENANMCYVSTNKVDREIEKLKKQQKDIAQKISQLSVSGTNDEKIKQLKQKLEQLGNELTMKNTDSYRKAHSERYF